MKMNKLKNVSEQGQEGTPKSSSKKQQKNPQKLS
jgi:hypothetical protein